MESTSYPTFEPKTLCREVPHNLSDSVEAFGLADLRTVCPGVIFSGTTADDVSEFLAISQHQKAIDRARGMDAHVVSLSDINWSHAVTEYDIRIKAPRIVPLSPRELLLVFTLKGNPMQNWCRIFLLHDITH